MADSNKKMIKKTKKIDKTYFDMTPEQKYEYAKKMLENFSPNEKIRNQTKK